MFARIWDRAGFADELLPVAFGHTQGYAPTFSRLAFPCVLCAFHIKSLRNMRCGETRTPAFSHCEFLRDKNIRAATEYGDVFDVLNRGKVGLCQRVFERVPFAGEDRNKAVGAQDAVDF